MRIVPKRPCTRRAKKQGEDENVYLVDETKLLVPDRHSS